MGYFKITSLTGKLPKRHQYKDKAINIDYRNNYKQTSRSLPVGGSLYISSPSLPVNLHKLRMKKLISVIEISKNAFMKLKNPKPVAPPVVEEAKKLQGKWNPDIEQEMAAFTGEKTKRTYKKKKENIESED